MEALLLDLGWKSALVAGLALLALRAMRGRAAAERVFLLRVAVAMLLMLPAAVLLLPVLDLAVLPAAEIPTMEAVRVVHHPAPVPVPVPHAQSLPLWAVLYFAVVVAILLHLAIGIAVLARWTRRAMPVADPAWRAALARASERLKRPVRLLASPDVPTPLGWGIVPAWILIDAASLARRDQADAVIAHELAHVRRFDWPMLLLARFALALFWCNPLVWLLVGRLARENEIAADEAAVRSIARADYAEALLAFATAPGGRPVAIGMALMPGMLAERIAHVVAPGRVRAGRRMLMAMLVCGTVAMPLIAAAKLVRATPVSLLAVYAPATASPDARAAERRAGPAGSTPPRTPVALFQEQPPAETRPVPVMVASPVPVVEVRAVPVVVASPRPVTRAVGQTGAVVEIGPNGTTPMGGAPEDSPEVQARHGQEEARRGAAEGLRGAAVDLRAQADELERVANEPNQLRGIRQGNLKAARDLRSSADKLEKEANKLTGD